MGMFFYIKPPSTPRENFIYLKTIPPLCSPVSPVVNKKIYRGGLLLFLPQRTQLFVWSVAPNKDTVGDLVATTKLRRRLRLTGDDGPLLL